MQNTAERTEQSTSSLVHLIKPTLWLAAHTSNTLLQVHNQFTANHSKPLSQAPHNPHWRLTLLQFGAFARRGQQSSSWLRTSGLGWSSQRNKVTLQ